MNRTAVERLQMLALASTQVESYKRRTKSGKTVDVRAHMRDVGSMKNVDLYKTYQSLTDSSGQPKQKVDGLPTPEAVKNRLREVTEEITKRQSEGKWGHSDTGAVTRAQNKVDRTKGAEDRGRTASRSSFAENQKSPKPAIDRLQKITKTDENGNEVTEPARDKDGNTVNTAEYDAHVQNVVKTLDEIFADPKKVQKYDTQRANGIFTPDGKFVGYSPERTEQHRKIIQDILDQHKDVPKNKQAIMSGGLGGAGKGTVLKGHPDISEDDYLTIDPDQMKEEILRRGMGPDVPGLLPMEQASFIHEESSDLANMLQSIALSQGMNIILDTTMAAKKGTEDESSADGKIQKFADAGYQIRGIFVDVPVDVSVNSALDRHVGGVNRFNSGDDKGGGDLGGRYVPPDYIRSASPSEAQKAAGLNSKNRAVFERLKREGKFVEAELWDTSDRTRPPRLVEKGKVGGEKPKGDASKQTADAVSNLKSKQKKSSAKEDVVAASGSAIDALRTLVGK